MSSSLTLVPHKLECAGSSVTLIQCLDAELTPEDSLTSREIRFVLFVFGTVDGVDVSVVVVLT